MTESVLERLERLYNEGCTDTRLGLAWAYQTRDTWPALLAVCKAAQEVHGLLMPEGTCCRRDQQVCNECQSERLLREALAPLLEEAK